jgi:DNA polymerase III subunit delta
MIYKSYLIEENINLINKNLFLFYGENLGLKEELKKNIKFENKNAEIINFIQDDVLKNEEAFFSEIFNVSLFQSEKIYFINEANDKIFNIVEKIENKINDIKIFFFSEVLDKRSKLRNHFEKSKNSGVAACYPDNEISIRKKIQQKLKGFEGLSAENINIIINSCGLDRVKLNNEIYKVITYFSDKKIKSDKLELLLDLKINDDFNLLKDEALNGNKLKTNKLLSDTIIETEKNVLYLNIINQRLNKLAEVIKISKNTNLENAISLIKPPVFWKDKPLFISQSKKWSSSKIKEILNKTYNLEIEIKSNSVLNKNILMKKLLIDICQLANS